MKLARNKNLFEKSKAREQELVENLEKIENEKKSKEQEIEQVKKDIAFVKETIEKLMSKNEDLKND